MSTVRWGELALGSALPLPLLQPRLRPQAFPWRSLGTDTPFSHRSAGQPRAEGVPMPQLLSPDASLRSGGKTEFFPQRADTLALRHHRPVQLPLLPPLPLPRPGEASVTRASYQTSLNPILHSSEGPSALTTISLMMLPASNCRAC